MSTHQLLENVETWNSEVIQQAETAELLAGEVMEEILTNGADILFAKYISQKTVPHTVDATLAMFANLMEMKHGRMDVGELEDWEEEKEPKIAQIDTWGRSSIPVRKKIVYKVPEEAATLASDARSRVSRSSRVSSTMLGKSMIKKAAEGVDGIAEENEGGPQPLQWDKAEVPEEEELLREKKEAEFRRIREQEANVKLQKLKDAENQKKIDRMNDDLKAKEYTYDHNGVILYVSPIKFEKMPSQYQKVGYLMPEEIDIKNRMAGKATNPAPAKSPKKPLGKPLLKKKPPAAEAEFVKNIGALQPPVFDTLKPVLGVTLIDGSRSKVSDVKKTDRKLLTREEYLRQTDKFAGPPKINVASVNDSQDHPELQKKIEQDQSMTIPEEETSITSHINLDQLEDIPNIDDEFLNLQRQSSYQGSADAPGYTDGNRIMQYSAGFPDDEDMSEIDKFNKKILLSTEWGINPPAIKEKPEPKLPIRPKALQQAMTHGNKPKLPRDRPYVDKSTDRQHDAPPRYGKTMRSYEDEL